MAKKILATLEEQLMIYNEKDYPLCVKCGRRTSPPMFSHEAGCHPCDNCGFLNPGSEVDDGSEDRHADE